MTEPMTLAEIGALINRIFAPFTLPEQPYSGRRCGWYPAKPKRRKMVK